MVKHYIRKNSLYKNLCTLVCCCKPFLIRSSLKYSFACTLLCTMSGRQIEFSKLLGFFFLFRKRGNHIAVLHFFPSILDFKIVVFQVFLLMLLYVESLHIFMVFWENNVSLRPHLKIAILWLLIIAPFFSLKVFLFWFSLVLKDQWKEEFIHII